MARIPQFLEMPPAPSMAAANIFACRPAREGGGGARAAVAGQGSRFLTEVGLLCPRRAHRREITMASSSPQRLAAVLRGFRGRCPSCGAAPLFARYLKPVARCAHCGAELGEIRADDFAPYLTIFLMGLLIVPVALFTEHLDLSANLEVAVLAPTALALTLVLLPRCKGAIIGLLWSLG
jgi:uncharacterized protein (DUF983 family)